jgi:long-chain acyl-CoA synthetase
MLTERLDRVAAQYGDQLAVVDGPEKITWRDLARRKSAFAHFLRRQMSVNAGQVVAACLPNCWEFIIGFLAAAEVGAVWVPVNPQWRGREIEWLAGRLPVFGVITNGALRDAWVGPRTGLPAGRVIAVDEPEVSIALSGSLAGAPAAPSGPRARFSDEPLCCYLTSGSTGRPRIVPRSHRNSVVGVTNAGRVLGIRPDMRILGVLPFHHASGFGNCMLLALLHGAAIVVMRKFHPRSLAEVVRSEKIDVLNGSPFIFRTLAESVSGAEAFRSVKVCTSAGAPMPPAATRQCLERLGLKVRQLYGASEVGTVSIEDGAGSGIEGAAGKILPEVEVRFLLPDGSEAPRGEPGEVVVRSPAVTSGYVGEPEVNQRAFIGGFFRTGDLGRLDADGNLFIVGRLKKLINVEGVKVDPEEIEGVLAAMPQVGDCRVSGIAGSGQTEVIAAQIALRPGQKLSRATVLAHLRANLADYKIPRVIQILEALPVGVSGKTPTPWQESV